ncbi:MAG TPA: cadherin repeat domain-containing protein [Arenimonas sp.]|uniref:cadherin repeat domain-containing protein n=1 Tax=Arenimonas sp. TaxID=1872635 RepID=UPI002D8045C6|nr:cadherin repeat domain-containing protein [Arenimonas sp.]HEU0152882.1 cadherin repeat domain-containing protein [Arenimonas sp.]
MTPASPPPPAPAPPPGPARTGLALGLIGAGLGIIALLVWLAYRTPPPVLAPADPVQAIATELVRKLNADLPRDLGDGLVLERMDVEGRNIIMTMRSRGMTLAEAARDPALFAQVKLDEQARLLSLCRNADFALVLDEGVVITRRFLDRENQRFFDVSVAAADCASNP